MGNFPALPLIYDDLKLRSPAPATPAYAPGTGTIEVGGWTGPETLDLVRSLKGINFGGYDLVEVMPYADPSQITAFLAGNIMFEFISLIALRKKERR